MIEHSRDSATRIQNGAPDRGRLAVGHAFVIVMVIVIVVVFCIGCRIHLTAECSQVKAYKVEFFCVLVFMMQDYGTQEKQFSSM